VHTLSRIDGSTGTFTLPVSWAGASGLSGSVHALQFSWQGELPASFTAYGSAPLSLSAGGAFAPTVGMTPITSGSITGTVELPGAYSVTGKQYGLRPTTALPAWVKPNPAPSVRKRGWRSALEHIVYALKPGPDTFNFFTDEEMTSALTFGRPGGSTRVHPTQKPIGLLKRLVEVATVPGDEVLNPFAGSGSTGEAALLLHRRALLVERGRDVPRAGHAAYPSSRVGHQGPEVRAVTPTPASAHPIRVG